MQVFREFVWTNPLHADIFPDIRRMEAEVVRMCVSLYHGDDNACGTVSLAFLGYLFFWLFLFIESLLVYLSKHGLTKVLSWRD